MRSNVVRFERPTRADLRDSFRRSLELIDAGNKIRLLAVDLALHANTLTFCNAAGTEAVCKAIAGVLDDAAEVHSAIAELRRKEEPHA